MRKISDEDMKVLALTMLKDVAKFCDDHNIKYYLCGGTLLGAVRHKGFIPWDDDIDIMMPRPDYLRFLELYNGTNPRYVVKGIENDDRYWRPFAKVFDLHTELDEPIYNVKGLTNHVFLDVFPVDGIPDDTFTRIKRFREQEILSKLCSAAVMNYKSSTVYAGKMDVKSKIKLFIRNTIKFTLITLLKPVSSTYLLKLVNRNAQKTDYRTANYVGTIVDCHYGAACEMLPKEGFENGVRLPFEDSEFWAMGNYKLYLQNLYGDYMKLPPESSRVTHHGFEAYWKDN